MFWRHYLRVKNWAVPFSYISGGNTDGNRLKELCVCSWNVVGPKLTGSFGGNVAEVSEWKHTNKVLVAIKISF